MMEFAIFLITIAVIAAIIAGLMFITIFKDL